MIRLKRLSLTFCMSHTTPLLGSADCPVRTPREARPALRLSCPQMFALCAQCGRGRPRSQQIVSSPLGEVGPRACAQTNSLSYYHPSNFKHDASEITPMKKSRGLSFLSTLLAGFFLMTGFAAAQQSPRGVTPEDYFAFEFISDPNISPDGRLVAYVVTKVDRAQNRRNSSIWMVATDGSRASWQFTTSP